MTDYPEDIRETAIGVYADFMFRNSGGISIEEMIARAILAERERCATIAERTEISAVLGVGILDGIQMGRRQIAAAIRGGSNA